ncbi:hypothetical protein TNCV_1978081, partial [Trichonephila clavipes]
SMLGYNRVESGRYPFGKRPLNDDYKWQCSNLNHHTDVQVCSQPLLINLESASIIKKLFVPDYSSRCRPSVYRLQKDCLQALT